MNRLTKNFGRYGLIKVKDNETGHRKVLSEHSTRGFESWQRLGAYEDTGLTPDEVETLKAERDRFKARAETAEADMKRIADDMDGETDACYPCALCVKNNSKCDVGDTCFEWRGPQEGAAEAKEGENG